MAEDVTRVSNHYIKMPAAVAVLRDPSVSSLFFVDLDAVTQFPWEASDMALKPKDYNDVRLRAPVVFGLTGHDSLAWQVHGSRYSLRGQYAVDFMARWFENRCSFKDQYSLWQTILELAGDAGCVDYHGEVWSELTYKEALHGSGADLAARLPGVALDCARVDARCPDWTFRKRGASCDHADPNLIDALYHRSLAGHRDTQVFAFDGGNITVANACFTTRGTPLENTTKCVSYDPEEYVAKLGIRARDRTRHAWG